MSRDSYQRVAGFYDRVLDPMNRGLRLLGLRMFPPDRGMCILDIGCGTGTHLEIYRRFGCELYGIDTSPSMLQMARARLGDSADLRLGDANQMPYDDQLFDLVLCMLTLHEMDAEDHGMVIGEIRRVLKIGGHILFIDFHTGRPRPIKGWLTKIIILLAELAAGRRHFRNYRHFMSIGGMPTLIEANKLTVAKEKVVGGDTFALHLLRAD